MLREFSAGGVVYKRSLPLRGKKEGGKVLWLVTRSTPSKLFPESFWRFPKGWLDDEGDSPGPLARGEKKATEIDTKVAAYKEVKEEAGVDAKIIKKIGTDKYFMKRGDQRIMKFVTYFLMEWVRDLPEGFGFETSEVAWLTYESARERLTHSSSKNILDKAQALL